jgi:hypothetical protein
VKHLHDLSPGARRDLLRRNPALAEALERQAQTEPGGTPDGPVEVTSASQVDVRAESTPCPLCGGGLRLEEHVAYVRGDPSIRATHVRCHMCGVPRTLYFRVAHAS